MDRTKKCFECRLGFPKVGNLTSEARLQEHRKTPHRNQCRECGMIELPALIDDELTAELDTVNDQYDEKDQEQDALEDVHSRSTTKILTKPEKTVTSGIKNENSQRGNNLAIHADK